MTWLDQLGGGLRDDYQLTILSAYFAPDAAYQDGTTFLAHLIGIDENGEPVTEKYNVGKTSEWVSHDGGKTLLAIGKASKINRTSMYGHLIDHAVTCGAGEVLMSRGDPTNSQAWIGLRFHMKEVEITYGKKIEPQHRNMPVEFLGMDTANIPVQGQSPGQQAFPQQAYGPVGTTTVASPVAPPVAPVAPPAPPVAPPQVLAPVVPIGAQAAYPAGLLDLAKSSPDFNTFVRSALMIEGVMTDDNLLSFVTDQNGFYAQNH